MHLKRTKGPVCPVRIVPLLVALASVGCGGGGGPSTNSNGGVQTSRLGPIALSFSGHPQPAIENSTSKVTTVGQAGASYSGLSINPVPNLDSTFLLISRAEATAQTFIAPLAGFGSAAPLVHSGNCYPASISQSGVIAFFYQGTTTSSIDTIKADGSGEKGVLTVDSTQFPAIFAQRNND